jgi:hypothetical protein
VDVADLQIEFSNMTFDSHKSNPIDWIEKLEANDEGVGAIKSEHLKDDFLMIACVFSQLPKDKYEAHITSEKKDLVNLKLKDMKKSISAHWKLFIKDNKKSDEIFYREDKKSKTGKKSWRSKKFKGDCRKCGEQGHKAVDCRVKSGNENWSTTGGANNNPKNAGVTCYACQAKGHCARDCPNKKKEEFGLFCGMICQEICDSEEENELDGVDWNSVGLDVALAVEEVEAPVEWKFEGIAQLLWEERNANREKDDDDSMPELFRRNCDDSSDDSSIPELLNRKSCYDSDSDSDDEEPQDFKMNCYVDMLGMWKPIDTLNTAGMEEVFNVESSTRGHDTVIVPWLLDAGASIHVETREGGVLAEKECHVTVNIADGKRIKPKGTGTKTIYDSKTGCPLKIEKMHVIPEFAKRILSVSKLIDDGFKVEFEREHAVIKDQSGKTIKCPRDSKSGLHYMHASESDDIVCASEENSEWKTVTGDENAATVEQKPTVL